MNLRNQLFGLYKDCPLSIRLYIRQRWIPFRLCKKLESYIPDSGRILDLGCGYGMFDALLALKSQKRKILGIDYITQRIKLAREVCRPKFDERVKFEVADITKLEFGTRIFDAITLIDVLCYLPFDVQKCFIEKCYRALAEKGILLIKDFKKKPLWKYLLFYIPEILVSSMRNLFGERNWRKIFRGKLFVNDQNYLTDILEKIGYNPKIIPLDNENYEPHILYVCEKI